MIPYIKMNFKLIGCVLDLTGPEQDPVFKFLCTDGKKKSSCSTKGSEFLDYVRSNNIIQPRSSCISKHAGGCTMRCPGGHVNTNSI
jgi:hypothetical protein